MKALTRESLPRVQVISQLLSLFTPTVHNNSIPAPKTINASIDRRRTFTERIDRLRMTSTVLAVFLRAIAPDGIHAITPIIVIHNNFREPAPRIWPRDFETPPQFAIHFRMTGKSIIVPLCLDFLGGENSEETLRMLFGILDYNAMGLQGLNTERIQQCRFANMGWHYDELIASMSDSSKAAAPEDAFFLTLARRLQ